MTVCISCEYFNDSGRIALLRKTKFFLVTTLCERNLKKILGRISISCFFDVIGKNVKDENHGIKASHSRNRKKVQSLFEKYLEQRMLNISQRRFSRQYYLWDWKTKYFSNIRTRNPSVSWRRARWKKNQSFIEPDFLFSLLSYR